MGFPKEQTEELEPKEKWKLTRWKGRKRNILGSGNSVREGPGAG